MRIKFFGMIAATITLVSAPLVAFACPCSEITQNNITSAPRPTDYTEGLAYTKTAEYKHDFDNAMTSAKEVCKKHLGEPNVAIVADIDETLVDNRDEYIKTQKFDRTQWHAWILEARSPALKPSADFIAWARQNGFAVFLITGRNEGERAATIENLVRDKIAYDGLYMRPLDCKDPAEVFKTRFRKQIEDMGFKVIVSMGDQYSDLVGGYAEDCEKLPNKMYFVP